MISRRSVLVGSAVSACLATTRFAFAGAKDLEGHKLLVATYGGSWRDAIVNSISKPLVERGASIDYVIGSPEDSIARIIAAKRQGQVPFDILSGFPIAYQLAVSGGLLARIDRSRLKNADAVPDHIFEEYQITTAYSPDCIVYNEDKLAEAKIDPPRTYADLANPALKGRVAFPDIGHVQHWAAIVGLAREQGGDEANLAPAVAKVNEINPAYFYPSSVDLAQRITAGDIWVAPWTAGWAVRLKRGNVPVKVVYPKFGEKRGALWPSIQWVVAGSPNEAALYAYLDSWLTVEGPAGFCDATGTVPVGTAAREIMRQNPENSEMLLLSDEDIANAYRVEWGRLDPKWREIWLREITR
jgi:putative spermidine/putrescine transport system substrate-binding protein